MQYVEIESAPEKRHILKTVLRGKGKDGNKQALTACGEPFAVDDAIVFAQSSSTLMDRPAAPLCGACNGLDEEAPEPAAAPSPTATPMLAQTIVQLSLDDIEPDPDQPRKFFDKSKLEELAESIRAHGVQHPIKVHPHPTLANRYIIEVGERRWRASEIAGMKSIPSIIEEPKHAGLLLELQLIENSQREGISPLEEGETYLKLKKAYGHTIESLMDRTGKSRTHVYARMKLTELAPAAKKALQEGKLQPTIAELATTIGDLKLQEQFVIECLGSNGKKLDYNVLDAVERAGIHHEIVSDQEEGRANDMTDAQPLSFRAAKALLRRRYSTSLALAKFDPGDATLTPAGACGPCPYRSGNQPELPGMSTGKATEDVCTKTTCFEEKTAAAWKKVAAEAKTRGLEVLDNKSAKSSRVFGYGGEISLASPYVDLETRVPYDLLSKPGTPPTFGKLLGKKAAEIPRVLVQDESGTPRELLDKAEAVKVLRELGKIDKPTKKPEEPKKSKGTSERAHYEKQKADAEINEAALTRLLAQVEDVKLPAEKDVPFLRWVTACLLSAIDEIMDDSLGVLLARRGMKHSELITLLEKAETVGDVRRVLAEILMCRLGTAAYGVSGYADKEQKDLCATGVKLLGLNWEKALAAAKEAAKIEAKVDAKKDGKAQAKPKKKGGRK